ncbi:MAG: hypothetical protein ACI9U0_001241 [Flavobacteriales bacterium]|jgi:hypothetical protein|tara:strand:- start:517 stop:924 length:408 start_codon:yes stop_codon:yes gene_type:complete
MKKDIEMPEVSGVYVAIVHEDNNEGVKVWNAYVINDKPSPIENVFVSSKGYLEGSDGVGAKSSTLRHFYKVVSAKSFQKVEAVIEDVFKLNNEYFVSFYLDGILFDKKFIFASDTISADRLTIVPVVEQKGILVK